MFEEMTSPETASFKILISALEWRTEEPENLTALNPTVEIPLSDFQPEAFLWHRKKPSLVDRILTIAESVPDEEWEKLPADLAERYRDYKSNIAE